MVAPNCKTIYNFCYNTISNLRVYCSNVLNENINILFTNISLLYIATYCSTIVFCFSLLCLLFLWAKMVSFSFSTLSFCLPFSQPLTHSRLSHSFSAIVGQSMLRRTRELNIVGIFWIFFRHRFSRFSCLPHSF